jgi:hypothetical protein
MSCGSTCWRQGYNGDGGIARVSLSCLVCPGLEGGEGGGCGLVLFFLLPGLFVVFEHLLDQEGDGAFALGGFADLGGWGEGAQFGMCGGLFDEFGLGGLGFGEVEAGDLEAVEEEAGAAGVDVVGGDALEDLADGVLDRGTVFWKRDLEGGAAAPAGRRVGGGFAGGVVVEAEVFSAEAGAAAAVAVGEDVAALEASGCFGLRCLGLWRDGVHWSLPHGGTFWCKVFGRKGLSLDFGSGSFFLVKSEGPAFGRAAVVQFL